MICGDRVSKDRSPMKRLYYHFINFWTTDRSVTALLVLSIITVLVIPSFSGVGIMQNILSDLILTLSLLAGIRLIQTNRLIAMSLAILVVLAVVIRLVSYVTLGQFVLVLR